MPWRRRGWRSPRRSASPPSLVHVSSRLPKALSPALMGHCAGLITAALWGRGIFISAVITAAHPQRRDEREQESRGWGACGSAGMPRHTRAISTWQSHSPEKKNHTHSWAPSSEPSPDGASPTAGGSLGGGSLVWVRQQAPPQSQAACPSAAALGQQLCLPCSLQQSPGHPPSPFHQHKIP